MSTNAFDCMDIDQHQTHMQVQIRQLKQELEATRSEYSKRLKALEVQSSEGKGSGAERCWDLHRLGGRKSI